MSREPWLQRTNSWAAWAVICTAVLAAVALFAGGTALHSPRFDGSSVAAAMLIATGALACLSAIGAFLQAVDW